jgi:hypothetical protein
MILLEPGHKILHTKVKFKRRTISVTPFSVNHWYPVQTCDFLALKRLYYLPEHFRIPEDEHKAISVSNSSFRIDVHDLLPEATLAFGKQSCAIPSSGYLKNVLGLGMLTVHLSHLEIV